MNRLLPAAALLIATMAAAPACAYEAPYQPGWGPAPVTPVWYQRPAPPPPRWGWRPPPPRWHAAPPPRRWAAPPHRGRGWDGPRQTRYDHRRHDDRHRGDRRW
ncbi:hypothetical protein GXW78_16660 [Roseomonas terrae]|uniref:Uncharacterized protein n=1 Tax=Neoroseomonas terrae TaxID=424799 RepID=A0ABS5EJV3_9PROT|nr:hypothetical protein [Neoroseomonas terrae]MBR0651306.1 hypothetical protein [Neoroseomonas terrae]